MISVGLTLTWDFFVIAFFAVLVAYAFILGKNHAMKVIIATYISIVAVQGIGKFLRVMTNSAAYVFNAIGFQFDAVMQTTVQLVLFTSFISLIVVRGGLYVSRPGERSLVTLVLTVLFGFSCAGLMLSTIFVFLSGGLLFEPPAQTDILQALSSQSRLIKGIIDYQPAWFTAPALLVLLSCVLEKSRE